MQQFHQTPNLPLPPTWGVELIALGSNPPRPTVSDQQWSGLNRNFLFNSLVGGPIHVQWVTNNSLMSPLKNRRGGGMGASSRNTVPTDTLPASGVCLRRGHLRLCEHYFPQPFTGKVIFLLEDSPSRPVVLAQTPLSLAHLPIQPQVTVPPWLWLVPPPSTDMFWPRIILSIYLLLSLEDRDGPSCFLCPLTTLPSKSSK